LPSGRTDAAVVVYERRGGPLTAGDNAVIAAGKALTPLATTAGVVALLLLVTYRSPVLWIVPLVVIGVGDQVVSKLLPWVARLAGERTDAAVSGIVSVLVFGAGTDYALLVISRYREELRRTPNRRAAMTRALGRAAPAILGSAATVILALLTLLAAVLTSNRLTSNRTLGVSAALGVGGRPDLGARRPSGRPGRPAPRRVLALPPEGRQRRTRRPRAVGAYRPECRQAAGRRAVRGGPHPRHPRLRTADDEDRTVPDRAVPHRGRVGHRSAGAGPTSRPARPSRSR
jgi:MMPL family